jgi:hypothetical protein
VTSSRPDGVDQVAELRIHGVGGSPGPKLLGYEDLDQTELVDFDVGARRAGPPTDDGRSVVIRRRKDSSDGLVEGFDWGNLNSGRWLQALWVFLLPFSLLNAAGWMLGTEGDPAKASFVDRAARWILIVLGIMLTFTWATWVIDLLVNYAGYQLLPSVLGDPTIVRPPAGRSFTHTADLGHHQAYGVAIGFLAAAVVLVGLGVVAGRSHRLGRVAADHATTLPGSAPVDASLAAAFEDARDRARGLAWLHGLAAAAAFVVAFLQVRNTFSDTERPTGLPIDMTLVVVSTIQLALLLLLWGLTRLRRRAKRAGPAAAAAALAFLLTSGFFAGATLWSVDHLPDVVRLPVCTEPTSDGTDDPPLACTTRGASQTDDDAGERDGETRPAAEEKASPALAAGRELAFVDGFGFTLLAWALVLAPLVGLVWWGRFWFLRMDPDIGAVPPDRALTVKRMARVATVTHGVHRLAGWLAVVAWAVLVVSSKAHIDVVEGTWWRWAISDAPTGSIPFRLAAWALPAFAVLVAFRVRKGASDNRVRRFFGQAWDVLSFFPRSYHPFAVRPYSHEVVPRFQAELRALLVRRERPGGRTGGSVLVSAHSQGSAVAFTALDALEDDELARIGLVTYGSHLGTLYRRCFPRWFGWTRADALGRRLAASAPAPTRWVNFYRATDPIGGPIFDGVAPRDIRLDDPAQAATPPRTGDVPLERDREPGTSIAGHSHYLAERRLKETVAALKEELE